ncbi:glycoside hydrolase family 79 protein [Peniophora sp. CONT]|nr:glycoside hydrolase family 79 protein [Peniophora sp. CONT]
MTCNIRSPSYPCRVSKMTFPVVPLLALAALCAAQSITIDVPSSPPADVSRTLDPALVSFSIELAYLDSFGGNASNPNNLTRALMANLEERTGQGPDVRPGGITIDSSIFAPNQTANLVLEESAVRSILLFEMFHGPGMYEALDVWPNSSKIVVSSNLGNNTISIARDELAAGIEHLGWDRIRSLELGNEPDHYGGGSRVSGWSSADYTAQFLGWTSFLTHNLSLPEDAFQACSFAEDPVNGEDFTTANTINEGILASNAIRLFNQHMYQYSTCDPARNAIATLPNLVNHTNITSYVNEFVPQVQAAAAVGKEFAIGEFSSVSCSGKQNVTDTYGQALWLADTILYSASQNISRMYLHQGATLVFQSSNQANAPGFSWYDLWYPVDTDRYGAARASPSYVSVLLIAETVGSSNTSSLAYIPVPSAPDLAAYAVYESGALARLTLLNLAHRNTTDSYDIGSVSVNVTSLAGEGAVKVKRMTAPGMDSKDVDYVTWAGQAYTNGTATGDEVVEEVDDGIVVVNGVEGVIVFFDHASST